MFQKTRTVRHLGHLDMQRAMQRALRRSGLPIKYSNGFNPHVVISFASPLPVGATGAGELFDTGLAAEVPEAEFLHKLALALPPALPIMRVRMVNDLHPALMAKLARAAYALTVQAEEADLAALEAAVPTFLAQKTISAIRKTKRGETPCDIRPMLHRLSTARTEEGLRLFAEVSFTEAQTLKPDLLFGALCQQAGIITPAMRVHREALLGLRNGAAVQLMDL